MNPGPAWAVDTVGNVCVVPSDFDATRKANADAQPGAPPSGALTHISRICFPRIPAPTLAELTRLVQEAAKDNGKINRYGQAETLGHPQWAAFYAYPDAVGSSAPERVLLSEVDAVGIVSENLSPAAARLSRWMQDVHTMVASHWREQLDASAASTPAKSQ